MFGCLRRIGCLALLLLIAAALWLTRDRWRARVFGEPAGTSVAWHKVTTGRSEQARASVETLGRKGGPAFVNLSADELGALLLASAGSRALSSVSNPEVAISGDRILLRATIQLDDLGQVGDLGPLAAVLKKREPFEASGTLDVVHPGLAEYRVETARIGELPIPRAMIPKLLARASKAERYEGVAPNGIPFEVPAYVADVRIARGRVTLYKNVQ
jgi:hypothetical protein